MPRASRLAAILLACLWAERADACTITTSAVAFGAYDTFSAAPDDGVGAVLLDCQRNSNPVISLGRGRSGSYAARRMSNGASQLQYNLFTTAARMLVWGDGTGGTRTVVPTAGAASGSRRPHFAIIYGRVPAGQQVTVGAYSDTLVVTVTF